MTNDNTPQSSKSKIKLVFQPGREQFLRSSSQLLDVMANVNRLQILSALSIQEMNVGELAYKIGLSQSALSQHLAKLRAANVVSTRREAQTIYYSCKSDAALRVLQLLSEYFDK